MGDEKVTVKLPDIGAEGKMTPASSTTCVLGLPRGRDPSTCLLHSPALLLKQRQNVWNVSQCSWFKKKCMKGLSRLNLLRTQMEPKVLERFAREVSLACCLMTLAIEILYINKVNNIMMEHSWDDRYFIIHEYGQFINLICLIYKLWQLVLSYIKSFK